MAWTWTGSTPGEYCWYLSAEYYRVLARCWQVDCSRGPASDRAGFSSLVQELSKELRPRGLLLSAAVSPSKEVIDAAYDVPLLR